MEINFQKRERCILLLSIFVIFLIKLIYIFIFTDYPHYLTSDAKGYWERALDRYNGNLFTETQWSVFPTFYHMFLAFLFKVYSLFNLFEHKLELTILLNIILSSISTYAIYFITNHIIENKFFSFITMLTYASLYTITYFNAFILSENFAIAFLIISIYLFLKKDRVSLILAGILLAFAVATRSNLIIVLPFLILLLKDKSILESFKMALVFLTPFFIIISFVVVENNYISKGKVLGLSANGGMNLYIAMCKPKSITSQSKNVIYSFGVAEYGSNPNLKDVVVSEKFHNQKYFIDLAKECIKNNPNIWKEKLEELKHIFFANLYPTYFSAKGFDWLILTSRYMLYFMSVTILFLFFLPLFFKSINKSLYLALLGTLTLSFASLYIFSFDHRLLYPSAFLIIIIFYIILYSLFEIFQKIRNFQR